PQISRGCLASKSSAASPRRAAAPGPRFCRNTSAPASSAASAAAPSALLMSSATDSLPRFSQTTVIPLRGRLPVTSPPGSAATPPPSPSRRVPLDQLPRDHVALDLVGPLAHD